MTHTLILQSALPLALASLLAASSAFAKLPAPTPEAQAKAADTAARTAWSAKVDTYKLCKVQDEVAAKYRASAQAAGKPVPPAVTTPSCADPGPYAAAATAAEKPIEASGAHSPATTAASPPSSNQTSAETNPAPKK